MSEFKGVKTDVITIYLKDRLDSKNAERIENAIFDYIGENNEMPIVMDLKELEYISSSGLRTLLRIKKSNKDFRVINVNSDVYEIFDMTGFNQIMDIEKAYRVVSVENCEEVGHGANGRVYRIDNDNVVKVYSDVNALEEIKHEREVAKKALILGIPTAISYDVVKVGDCYGSVFELLSSKSFSQILDEEPDKFEWCVDEAVKMLRRIHETEVDEGDLPEIRLKGISWAKYISDYLPQDTASKLISVFEKLPYNNHMVHGDFHSKNIHYVNSEVLRIDMDTLAVGHPVFEFAAMYSAFIGYNEGDSEGLKQFLGIDLETSTKFFEAVVKGYLGDASDKYEEVLDKAKIVAYTRMIRRNIKRGIINEEKGKAQVELWTGRLIKLLEKYDSIDF